jgi:hypothetical protein
VVLLVAVLRVEVVVRVAVGVVLVVVLLVMACPRHGSSKFQNDQPCLKEGLELGDCARRPWPYPRLPWGKATKARPARKNPAAKR